MGETERQKVALHRSNTSTNRQDETHINRCELTIPAMGDILLVTNMSPG